MFAPCLLLLSSGWCASDQIRSDGPFLCHIISLVPLQSHEWSDGLPTTFISSTPFTLHVCTSQQPWYHPLPPNHSSLAHHYPLLLPPTSPPPLFQGHEIHWATNYHGHFVLTELLMDLLEAAQAPRVVVVTSHLHTLVDSASPGYIFSSLPIWGTAMGWIAYCR